LTELDAAVSQTPRPSVFLSYASEDRQAARLLRDALPDYGLDVWYDESDIGGGEAWDQREYSRSKSQRCRTALWFGLSLMPPPAPRRRPPLIRSRLIDHQ